MKVTITTNGRDLARKFRAMRAAAVVEQTKEATFIADVLTKDGREQLGAEVYRIPIKRSPTGRRLWTRTGRLYAAERWVAAGMHVRHENLAPHYLHRLRYGTPAGRPASPPQRRWGGPRVTVARRARWIGQRRQMAHLRAVRAGIRS